MRRAQRLRACRDALTHMRMEWLPQHLSATPGVIQVPEKPPIGHFIYSRYLADTVLTEPINLMIRRNGGRQS